mgnify:CR=1 FL=1
MKKVISLVLSIVIMLSATAGLDFFVYANETENSGSCGDNVTYYFDSSIGVLTIEGNGAIYDYDNNEAPWYAFSKSISKVIVKEGITIIGEHAFESCELYDLELPSTLTKINNWAFYGADKIENVYITDLESWFGVKMGYSYAAPLSFSFSKNKNMYLNNTLITNIIVPDSVNEINSYLFYDCTSLESVIIPSNVKSIGESAFRGCSNLQSVSIENGIDKIKDWTFEGCTSLKNLSITNSIKAIGDYSFYDCESLSAIDYTGTEIDWNNISIGKNNEYLINSTIDSHCKNNSEHIRMSDKSVPATCTSTGLSKGSHCTKCGGIIEAQEITPLTEHSVEIDSSKAATCISTGLTEGSHCSVCGETLIKQESTPTISHMYLPSVVQATEIHQGYKIYTCTMCGDTYNADYFDAASVYSDVSSATAGSTIRVPVSIKNNTGILGWKLTFDYDTDVLTPISVDYGEVISGGIQDNIEGDMVPGSINVYWAGSDNEDYNGVMFYINFEVNPSAVGNTKIDITYSPEDTFDTDFNDVYLDCQPINLSITNNAYSQYAKINASADDVTAGDDLQLKLNISEINSVSKTNVTVDYNSDNFEFKSVSAVNGIIVKNTDNNGKLALDISGITSAVNDADFVTVTFKCKDKAMSGDYDFAVSSADKGIICKGCSVKIKPSATSEIADIYADDVAAEYNDEITIPIYIDNNHGIMGYRLDFKYDTNVLEPISTTCDAAFANGGQFNDSIGVKDGEFKVLWNNVDEKYAKGILLNLKIRVLTDEKLDTVISMTYSQPDTFNEKYEDVVFNCKDINISLNNHQHSYIAVVTEPTCIKKGYTTYTCSCGDSYIDDETAALGHSYGQWTYNGDAEYVSSINYKNGTQTRTCSVCGEEETVEAPNTALLRRRGNALALESSITLTTYITKDIVDYYDEVYAEFTRNGKTETVYASDKTFKSGSMVYNIFDYAGISPQAMGDDIEIKFYGIKDGVKYWGETYTYSVTTYVTSTLSKSVTSDKLKTMLVDLMYYGEACQIYQNYKTDSLMTNILTDEQKKFKSSNELNLKNIKDSSYATCENRLVRFGTALRLNNAVEIAIPLNMTNVTLEELTFKVKIGSRNLTYTYSDNPENFEKGKDGYWYFYFDGVYANQMSDEVFITAYRGDEQVSYTLKYSVESYAATVTDSKLKKVTDAMMRYGNSAKAYSGK